LSQRRRQRRQLVRELEDHQQKLAAVRVRGHPHASTPQRLGHDGLLIGAYYFDGAVLFEPRDAHEGKQGPHELLQEGIRWAALELEQLVIGQELAGKRDKVAGLLLSALRVADEQRVLNRIQSVVRLLPEVNRGEELGDQVFDLSPVRYWRCPDDDGRSRWQRRLIAGAGRDQQPTQHEKRGAN